MISVSSLSHRGRLGRGLVWALALSWVASPAWSGTPAFSFDAALRRATTQAPALDARASQIEARQQDAVRAAALPDPTLKVGIANLPVTGTDAFDTRADFMTMKQVGLMQAFPARAKRQARQNIAERQIEQAQAVSEAEHLAVQRAVARAWIGLWSAHEEQAALQSLREPTDVAIRAAQARHAGGSGTAVEVMATQQAALELDDRIDATAATLNAARATLARWLDAAPPEVRIEGAPPDVTQLPVAPAALLAAIDRQAPLRPWQAREAVAAAQLEAAIAQTRPDWQLGVIYGQRDRSPAGMPRSDMVMVEFAIDLPLFGRNRQDRGIAARRADLDAVNAEREEARRAQVERVRKTVADWEALTRRVARQAAESLPLVRDRAQTALAAYSAGGPLQPWLEARRDEVELQIRHARERGELGRAWADLAFLLPAEETMP